MTRHKWAIVVCACLVVFIFLVVMLASITMALWQGSRDIQGSGYNLQPAQPLDDASVILQNADARLQ